MVVGELKSVADATAQHLKRLAEQVSCVHYYKRRFDHRNLGASMLRDVRFVHIRNPIERIFAQVATATEAERLRVSAELKRVADATTQSWQLAEQVLT